MFPHVKIVSINHWDHHVASAHEKSGVKVGLQHGSFQPMLVNVPYPWPESMQTKWNHCEDDEFCWRFCSQFGSESMIKLRYIIGKFDVGKKAGGMQSDGMVAGKARAAEEAREIMSLHADAFAYQERKSKDPNNRQSGDHVRLKLNWRTDQTDVLEHGQPAGMVLEACMSME